MNILVNWSIAKMRSAVPHVHHPSEWAVLGWVSFLCTVLGSDLQSDYKVLKTCVQVSQPHRVILQAYDGMSISL